MSFRHIQAGDIVNRNLGGAPMKMKVTEVDDDFIYCGPKGVGWKFDRSLGVEVDEDLGWGPDAITGSFLEADDSGVQL